ncbi:hypothetical protein B0J11DRAFT_346587 [Dendryphion nanum]|uniref:Uncharacterized protein n=1 Tax=Dendryphion nanum TaxID=256645 RepID=A0A9P9DPH6_9PLEO|nr:hypothetical protein B0J11DRAFT_346587 [Dendryphion nanum]
MFQHVGYVMQTSISLGGAIVVCIHRALSIPGTAVEEGKRSRDVGALSRVETQCRGLCCLDVLISWGIIKSGGFSFSLLCISLSPFDESC